MGTSQRELLPCSMGVKKLFTLATNLLYDKFFGKIHQLYDFDSIVEEKEAEAEPGSPDNKLNTQYLFPIACSLAGVIDSALIYARQGFHYSSTGNSDLFEHKIYPQDFWVHSDVILYAIHLQGTAIHSCLLVEPMLGRKYTMYLVATKGGGGNTSLGLGTSSSNGSYKLVMGGGGGGRQPQKKIDPKLTEAMLKFRSKAQKLIKAFIVSAFAEMYSDFFTALYGNWAGGLRDYLLIPYTLVFFFYGNHFFSNFVFLNNINFVNF